MNRLARLAGLMGAPCNELGAAANFDDLVKFGDRRQIRRFEMFIKCDVNFMSHPITQSLGSKLQ